MNTLFNKKFISHISPWLDWVGVLLALAVFTALVIPNLVGASAYFDEGYSAYLAKFDPLTTAAYTAHDVHPPLYYVALHFWQGIVGDGVTELRLLSVVFAWVAIILAFILVRRWFGRKAALLALVLVVLSPLFIRYSGVMRMYSMAVAIALGATYVLLRAIGSKGKKWWLAYAALVAAGMWTNYLMALIWASHLIWVLYEHRKNSTVIRPWRRSLILAFILYLPWLPLMLFRYGEVQIDGFWIKPPTLDTFVSTISMSVLFRTPVDTTTWLAIGLIAFIIGLVIAIRHAYPNMSKEQQPVFRLLLALSTLPIILLTALSLPPLRPSYVYRYVLIATVFSALLIGVSIMYAKFKEHQPYRRFILGLLAISLFALGAARVPGAGDRSLDMGSQNKLSKAIDYVHASDHKATIVTRSAFNYFVARLYETPDFNVRYLYSKDMKDNGATRPLLDHPEEGVKDFTGLDKVWLVGENAGLVSAPSDGTWVKKANHYEYDSATGQLVAAAAYYEKVK